MQKSDRPLNNTSGVAHERAFRASALGSAAILRVSRWAIAEQLSLTSERSAAMIIFHIEYLARRASEVLPL